MPTAKSRFRPKDPDAVHRRFEEIKSRVTRRLDEEWSKLVRTPPRPGPDDGRPDESRGRRTAARKR